MPNCRALTLVEQDVGKVRRHEPIGRVVIDPHGRDERRRPAATQLDVARRNAHQRELLR